MAHSGGRPSKLNKELIDLANEYMESLKAETNNDLATIEGLALKLSISRDTVYEWENIPTSFDVPANLTEVELKQWEESCTDKRMLHKQFSDIVSRLRAEQGQKLIQYSLQGKYNPTIAKLILSGKHGYVEKAEQDITSGGEKLTPLLVKFIGDKDVNATDS